LDAGAVAAIPGPVGRLGQRMKSFLKMAWILWLFDKITSEQLRIGSAWIVFVSTLLWIAAFAGLIGQDEPPLVLHLSIGAVWFSAATLLIVTDLEKKAEENT
jgi:hypothetical protein